MKHLPPLFIAFTIIFCGMTAIASPRVDQALQDYDQHVEASQAAFAKKPRDVNSIDWVKSDLAAMVEVDQYMRLYPEIIYKQKFTDEEKTEFNAKFLPRSEKLDRADTAEVQALLKTYDWFTISKFGKDGDDNGWLLVQHADLNIEFQKQVLARLEKIYRTGESKPDHYAYLFDRVASSSMDKSKSVPQRYGTQGSCKGPGRWEPDPIEDPAHVDERRASVGLPSMAEYKTWFKDICH